MSEGVEQAETRWDAQPAQQVETLAERVARMERELAALRDTSQMEQNLAAKVMTRIQESVPNGFAGSSDGGSLVPASLFHAMLPAVAARAVSGAPGLSAAWSLLAQWREFRLIFRMYFDPRYRLSRVAQFGGPVILGLMVLNYFTFSFWSVPILAPIFERVILILLALTLYKILSREALRYDEVLKYLSRYGH
ncbi:hypothetical protein [Fimbriiglobus ruber]|uniref:Uncharacterized protein n=1 Tax=Fimbriiglobus ruber TaxID=1908690 RepID=A0A225EFI7_9BACT|nr:hypothetical protein [Fimbriiglobus ruber]OWK47115.1 hypothetical protein FRUB_00814 [Fimbriiglobus ruber]